MNYISEKEFFKQDEKVRENILRWWKPQRGDICYHTTDQWMFICDSCKGSFIEYNNFPEYHKYLKSGCIPLLAEGQLIQFIEDTTQSKIDMSFYFESNDYHDGAVGYEFEFYRIYKGKIDVWGSGETVKIKEIDKLKAIWQLACKVANEI